MCVLTSQFLYMHCSAGSSTAATFQSESTKLATQLKLVSVLVPPWLDIKPVVSQLSRPGSWTTGQHHWSTCTDCQDIGRQGKSSEKSNFYQELTHKSIEDSLWGEEPASHKVFEWSWSQKIPLCSCLCCLQEIKWGKTRLWASVYNQHVLVLPMLALNMLQSSDAGTYLTIILWYSWILIKAV